VYLLERDRGIAGPDISTATSITLWTSDTAIEDLCRPAGSGPPHSARRFTVKLCTIRVDVKDRVDKETADRPY